MIELVVNQGMLTSTHGSGGSSRSACGLEHPPASCYVWSDTDQKYQAHADQFPRIPKIRLDLGPEATRLYWHRSSLTARSQLSTIRGG